MAARRRLIVIDWNFVRGKHPEIPAEFDCLISDQLLHEVAHSLNSRGEDASESFLLRAIKWMQRRPDQIWVGKRPAALFQLQIEQDSRLTCDDMIHFDLSLQLRSRLSEPRFDWNEGLSQFKGGKFDEEIGGNKAAFTRFSAKLNDVHQNLLRSGGRTPRSDAIKEEFCADPAFIRGVLEDYPSVVPSHWVSNADRINRFAWARWMRLAYWYGLNFKAGKNFKPENNYDDAHYALLASYTGHLATADRGLRKAVSALFHGIRLWPREGDVHEI